MSTVSVSLTAFSQFLKPSLRSFKDVSTISTQVREEATGRLYRVINAFEKEDEESWCSVIILGRLALILGIAVSAVAGIVLLAAGRTD